MSEEYLHQMNEGEDHDENMQEHEEGEMIEYPLSVKITPYVYYAFDR